jgi:transposase-like protein
MGATKGGTRRKHSNEFRAEVLAQCRQPGKSIAGVALKHGLNANMVRIWLRKSELSPVCQSLVDPPASPTALEPQQFVAVRMDVPPVSEGKCAERSAAIQLELRRGNSTAIVIWPSELVGDCGAWLREWLR